MEEIKSKISLVYAAFLHDIGKIAQRTGTHSENYNNETVYQMLMPYFHQGKPSHFHTLYTYDFFEKRKHFSYYKIEHGETEDNVATLSFKHHNPSTPLQKLMAESDRLSSGQDRKDKDEQDENDLRGQKVYLKTPLQSLFGLIELEKNEDNKPKEYFLSLRVFPKNFQELFPKHKSKLKPVYGDVLTEQYKNVYQSFCKNFDEKFFDPPNTFWELSQFLVMCERHFYSIPSSTINVPDINLYDHCSLIAAIAVAAYDYHKENGLNEHSVLDRKLEKYRLIQGDLSGIQSYILNFKHEATSGLAKMLRARSFYLQMITKSIEKKILDELQLPPTSVIMSAGSKFQILVPNTSSITEKMPDIQSQVDKWLLDRYMGDVSFQIDWSVGFSGNDFLEGRFTDVLLRAGSALDQKKNQKFQTILFQNNWEKENFLFSKQYELLQRNGACNVHGYYPGEEKEEENNFVSKVAIEERDVGTKLTHNEFISIGNKGKSLPFGNFSFNDKTEPFRLHINFNDYILSYSFIGKLPKFKDRDKTDYTQRYCKNLCNEYKDGLCEILNPHNDNKSFHCLAQEGIRKNSKNEYVGESFLGIFKADVDRLGEVFTSGLKDNYSISRYSTLSKNLNFFFTEYLYQLLNREEFSSIYTVYSGGDDLFLLGPYTKILKFAKVYYEDFREFTCENPSLTFSAGFALLKPRQPIQVGGERAEDELENAKDNGRNSISLFGNSLKWKEYFKCLEIVDEFIKYIDLGLPRAFLYRLLRYTRMHKESKSDPVKLMYRSHFAYDKRRNIHNNNMLFKDSEDQQGKKNEFDVFLSELFQGSYNNKEILSFLEVPLQLAIYQSR